jgi:hypothetical protein
MDIHTKIGEVIADLLLEDFEPGLGSLVRFEQVIDGVRDKFSIEITNDNIREALKFIHDSVPNSENLLYATRGTAGLSPTNIPYVKGELGPNDLNWLKHSFSEFNKLVSKPPPKFFVKVFTTQQMTFLTVALMKNIFPRPKKGQLLIDKSSFEKDELLTLVFERQYFDTLYLAIEKAYDTKSFAKSNSEIEWNDLRNAIRTATGTTDIDLNGLTDHIATEE